MPCSGTPPTTRPLGRKKLVPASRSINWKIAAACNAGNASSSNSAVTSCDQMKKGSFANVTPGARHCTIVTSTLMAPSVDDKPTRKIPTSQKFCPAVAITESGTYDVHPELAAPPSTKKLATITSPPGEIEPVAERVETRKRHLVRADLQRHEVVAERARGQRHDGQKHHHRAVHRHQLVVELRQHHAPGALASPSPAAIHPGSGWPGHASCHRIRIIRRKPTSRKKRAVRPYCRPTVLWSVQRTQVIWLQTGPVERHPFMGCPRSRTRPLLIGFPWIGMQRPTFREGYPSM